MDPLTLALLAGGGTLLASGVQGYFGAQGAEAAGRAQLQGQQAAIGERRQAYEDISPMYNPYQQAGEYGLAQLLAGQRSGALDLPTMDKYQYGGDVEQFLDPSMEFEQSEALRQMQASQAAQSGMYSGAAMQALQDRSQNVARGGYGAAYGRMESDRAFDYNDYMNQFNSQTAAVQAKRANLQNLSNLGFGATQSVANARTGMGSDVAGMQIAAGDTRGQMAAAPYVAGQGVARDMSQAIPQAAGMYQQGQQNQQLLNYLAGPQQQGPAPVTAPQGVIQGNISGMEGYTPAGAGMQGYVPNNPTLGQRNRSYYGG